MNEYVGDSQKSPSNGLFQDERHAEVEIDKYNITVPTRITAPIRPASSRVSSDRVDRTSTPAQSIIVPCQHIRIGDLLLLQRRPCQVLRISTSNSGQSRYLGVDIFTRELHEDTSFTSKPAPSFIFHNMLAPTFKQYRVLDIYNDTHVVAMIETGDTKERLPVLHQNSLLQIIVKSFESRQGSVIVLVIDDGSIS